MSSMCQHFIPFYGRVGLHLWIDHTVIWIGISLMMRGVEHLFTCLLGIVPITFL